jgi:hypothetical protein
MVFTPTEVRFYSLGGRERVLPRIGMTCSGDRGAVRHWLPGCRLLGDLVVRTTGAQADHFELPNVVNVGKKLTEIERLT